MKKFINFTFLGLLCALSMGLQAAEKDAKPAEKTSKATTKAPPASPKTFATPMEELNYKYDKLVQLNYQRHNELLKILKDIREQKSQTAPKEAATAAAPTEAPKAQIAPTQDEQGRNAQSAAVVSPASTATTVAETAQPTPTDQAAKIETPVPSVSVTAAAPTPVAEVPVTPEATAPTAVNVVNAPVSEPTTNAPAIVAVASSSSPEATSIPSIEDEKNAQALPQTAAPAAVKIELPEEFTKSISSEIGAAKSFGVLAFVVSVISLISMGFLIMNVRKSDEKIRRMLWKTEVDHLRDEVIGGRPQLKVEKSYDRLILTNTGTVIADEIKLSLGPAPRTMKQRLRVLARIEANEKAEVEIGPQQATDGQIYGTLEYRNCETGKLFKEQFILKVDSVTGELIPIQQAV